MLTEAPDKTQYPRAIAPLICHQAPPRPLVVSARFQYITRTTSSTEVATVSQSLGMGAGWTDQSGHHLRVAYGLLEIAKVPTLAVWGGRVISRATAASVGSSLAPLGVSEDTAVLWPRSSNSVRP